MPNPPLIQTIGPKELTKATEVLATIPVGNYTHMSIYAADGGGGTYWSTAVVGVKWRNSPDMLPVDFSTGIDISGPNTGVGMDSSEDLDVSRVAYIDLVTDTAQAGTKGVFYVCAKDNRGA